jgi:hypothetical protein
MRWIVLVVLVGSCRSRSADGAPCGSVAGHFFTLASDQLAKSDVEPAVRQAVAEQLPAMRDSLDRACSDGAWSAQVRDCMIRAADHTGLEACERQLTDDQRRTLDRAARGSSAP